MSGAPGRANVEVVQRFYASVKQFLESFGGDDDALAAALTAEEELRRTATIADAQGLVAADALWEPLWSAAPFRGPGGIIEYGVAFTEAMGEWSYTADSFVARGNRVIADCTVRTRGKGSGVRTEQRMWNVFDVRGGQIVRYREFVDEADAIAAAEAPD